MASRQQTLWDWASESAQYNVEEIRPKVKGKLALGELPAAPAREMFDMIRKARELHLGLEGYLGKINLSLTNNRRRMLTVKLKREAKTRAPYYELRLHHMFLGCGEEVMAQLVGFIRGEDAARQQIQRFIQRNREAISHDVEHADLNDLGQFHDLEWLMKKASDLLQNDPELEGIKITWGRKGKGKRSIRLGSYDFEQRLVRIHPSLDQRWVPGFFIEYIIYHELLHALYPPVDDGSGRRDVHTKEFRQMEELYPHYKEALAWEAQHIHLLLQSQHDE